MTQFLVTGGAGFIGSHLVAALLAQGAKVRVLDDLSSGAIENLAGLDVEFIEGDVADFATVLRATADCAAVFHQAALVSVPRSIAEPSLNHRSNMTGTFNVFEAARQSGVRRVVYASSAAVYGDLPGLPKRESDPLCPNSPYGVAKRTSELLAATYAASYGITFVGLRYANVFGPWQDPSSAYSGVLSIFSQAVIHDTPVQIFGDGEQTRDFVFVEDVVQANLLALQVPAERLTATALFNIGQGKQTSLNQILEILEELAGKTVAKSFSLARQGDIKHSVLDISHAQKFLGYQPRVSVAVGLEKTLVWFRKTAA